MRIWYSYFGILVLLGCLAAPAVADVLALSSAETFTGRLVRVREGSLVFRTSLQGQMMVPMDHVQSIATEGNFVITLNDESVRYGQFMVDEGSTVIKAIDGSGESPVTLVEVREATPLPSSAPAPVEKTPELSGLKTDASVGIQARSGNKDGIEPVASLQTSMRSEAQLVEGGLSLERSDPEGFPRWLRGNLYWRTDTSAVWSPYAGLELSRDADNALALRGQLQLGMTRLLSPETAGERAVMEALLGLDYAYEEWSAAGESAPWENNEGAEDEVALHLELKFAKSLSARGSLRGSLGVYPSVTNAGDWRAASEASWSFPVGDKLRLKFNLILDYNSDPGVATADRLNTGLGASVQVGF